MSVRSTTNTIHNVFPKCRHCCIPKKLRLNIRNVINITSCHKSHKCYMIFINWHDKLMYIMTFYQAAIITKRTYNTVPRSLYFMTPLTRLITKSGPTRYQFIHFLLYTCPALQSVFWACFACFVSHSIIFPVSLSHLLPCIQLHFR